MALLFEDDNRRLTCKCGNKTMYKKEILTYIKSAKDKDSLEEYLVNTELCCLACNNVVKSIKPGSDKILT